MVPPPKKSGLNKPSKTTVVPAASHVLLLRLAPEKLNGFGPALMDQLRDICAQRLDNFELETLEQLQVRKKKNQMLIFLGRIFFLYIFLLLHRDYSSTNWTCSGHRLQAGCISCVAASISARSR